MAQRSAAARAYWIAIVPIVCAAATQTLKRIPLNSFSPLKIMQVAPKNKGQLETTRLKE
jgi:hypothetical protein